MARNKRNKPNKSTGNNESTPDAAKMDQNRASGSSGSSSTSPPMDPSDLTWLNIDSMNCVDDIELHQNCTRVVRLMRELELDFGMFVWAVNFGNMASRTPQDMQTARSQFQGTYLIPTLQNLWKPPRTLSKGKAPANSCEKIDTYALALVQVGHQFRNEMHVFETTYGGIRSKDLHSQVTEHKLLMY